MIAAGPVTVTYLEMGARPARPRPVSPAGAPVALLAAAPPPVWWFLALYREVGRDYGWSDKLDQPEDDLARELTRPGVAMHTLFRRGAPAGFFLLDASRDTRVNLAYFGLVGEAIGLGLGRFLLETAIDIAWASPGCRKLTVNTCTLDHPRALGLYQRAGFVPVRRETRPRPPTPAEPTC